MRASWFCSRDTASTRRTIWALSDASTVFSSGTSPTGFGKQLRGTGSCQECSRSLVLIATVFYVSAAGHAGYSFLAPIVFAVVVFVFSFENPGPVSRLLLNRGSAWLGRISYSIYMWQAFIIFNFVDRPVSMLEKMTGHSYTTVADAASALGGEAGKLIVLGGQILPIVATLLFVGLLVAVASVSYYLVERPGQELFARLARLLDNRSAQGFDPSLSSARSARGA